MSRPRFLNTYIALQVGLQWFLARTGAASSSHLETGGFIRSGPGVPHPDIQFHFLPSQVLYSKGKLYWRLSIDVTLVTVDGLPR